MISKTPGLTIARTLASFSSSMPNNHCSIPKNGWNGHLPRASRKYHQTIEKRRKKPSLICHGLAPFFTYSVPKGKRSSPETYLTLNVHVSHSLLKPHQTAMWVLLWHNIDQIKTKMLGSGEGTTKRVAGGGCNNTTGLLLKT